MHDLGTAPATRRPLRTAVRWMPTFLGFPAGGYATYLLVGPIDGAGRALLGGLLTGAVLGAAQALSLRRRLPAAGWVAATAIGLAIGLTVGATLVGFRTGVADLVLQGLVSGAAVGAAQALVLRPVLGRLAAAWPPVLGLLWAGGWAITAAAGIQVDERFSVFGSSGAVVVTALTAVLPILVERATRSAS